MPINYILENIQKIRKKETSAYKAACTYFSILSITSDLKLKPLEIKYLGFLSMLERGYVLEEAFKDKQQIATLVYKLRKKGVLLKDHRKPTIHPLLLKLDFTKPAVLNITLEYNDEAN